MNLNEIQERISWLLSFFVTEVKGATAMGRADINHVSEVVLVPLLSKVFDYPNLTNLNYTEQANYPGIDLGDAVARVSFQVTSTSNSKKVKETLDKFVSHELYEKYDRLIIYNLAEKQGSYSGEGFEDIIKDKFKFDKDTDIIDYSDVLKVVAHNGIRVGELCPIMVGGFEPLFAGLALYAQDYSRLHKLSIYTKASLHPVLIWALIAGTGLVLVAANRGRWRRNGHDASSNQKEKISGET